ncbi:ATP-binding protein [Sphingomonas aracearum]|uniref:histidine kinase n=1 Tax=Sphingomonas aracearum TaxID=2283317 RepID=A0A369VWY5_9SPHN|nr:ATP-binding protein [Sphingomonas aracearum]RDE05680.1 sensor histidine kinase [Sphingomonas aracearum]
MDKPLLALTRPPDPAGLSEEAAAAADNMRQLIQLRWIAVAGQIAAILAVHYGLSVPLPLPAMLGIAALLAAANLGFMLALPQDRVRNTELVALLIDMAALTGQLYLSGGATNPFIALYLLQVVLGAILLPPCRAAMLMLAASLCYGWLSTCSVPLRLPPSVGNPDALFRLGHWISFVMVGTLLVLFSTRISRNLRARDRHLAELTRRAAEEDGIVRMGLFASGAAHELGTPLGSLSVILADWRRDARFAADSELAGEIAVMEAEVGRCKAIVSDILYSAGEPRGEAMTNVPATDFFREVADAWRVAQPQVPLAFQNKVSGRIVAEPALRQALWNLLDNAAEVSPSGIGLETRHSGAMLRIDVTDDGPGFSRESLDQLGKLYQSSKGAGRGLGLFLASNVARRLGGRLEARNRPEGGAAVTLLLPLMAGTEGQERHG